MKFVRLNLYIFRYIFLSAVALLFLSGCATGPKITKPFLYEARRDNGGSNIKVAYFFGTMHANVTYNQLPHVVEEKLFESEAVALESIENGEEHKKKIGKMLNAVELPADMNLRRHLLPAAVTKAEILYSEGCSQKIFTREACQTDFAHFNPLWLSWLISYFEKPENSEKLQELLKSYPELASTAAPKKTMYVHHTRLAVIDDVIQKKAETRNKIIKGLDKLDRWFWAIMALEDGAADLNFHLAYSDKEVDAHNDRFMSLWQGYLAGDEEAIRSRYKKKKMWLLGDEWILKNRNIYWMPSIESLLEAHDKIFVAVGVAHLLGPDNVLDMMKERGYTITRVAAEK